MQLKLIRLFFFCMLCIQSLSAQYFHVPHNDVYGLELRESKDLKLSVLHNFSNRTHLKIGYSPWKHVSISGSYFRHYYHRPHYETSHISTDGQSFTVATGLYGRLRNPFVSNFFVFNKIEYFLIQGYIGYSKSNLRNDIKGNSYIDINHQNIFARWSVLVQYKFLSLGLSAKYATLDFQKADATGKFQDNELVLERLYSTLENNKIHGFSGITKKIGIHLAFVEIYFDQTINFQKNGFHGRYNYFNETHSNLGLIIDINELHRVIRERDKP